MWAGWLCHVLYTPTIRIGSQLSQVSGIVMSACGQNTDLSNVLILCVCSDTVWRPWNGECLQKVKKAELQTQLKTTSLLSAPLDDALHAEVQVCASVCVTTCLYKLYFHFMCVCVLEMGLYYSPPWVPIGFLCLIPQTPWELNALV